MEQCDKQANISKYCNCTYSCPRKGKCCECLAYHRRMGQLPGCFFPDDEESSYDRSVDNFIRIYKEGRMRMD
jgi:hypothetical protein